MADTWHALIAALTRFLLDAITARDQVRITEAPVPVNSRIDTFAAHLASLPSAVAARHAATTAANENGYLVQEPRVGVPTRAAGRALSADALVKTGVAEMLLSGDTVDVPMLTAELAGYLAGPPIPIWEYAMIDADLTLDAPVPVVNGWELVTPTSRELADLVGVPSAAQHVTERSFRHDLYGGSAMLRRKNPDRRPHRGDLLPSWPMHPARVLWQPLLAISLYQNPVVDLCARYIVEPGRRVDVLFDHVYTEIWSPDGLTEVEYVPTGLYKIDALDAHRFRRFLELLAGRIEAATAQPAKPTKRSREKAARLRRIAEHFLTAGENANRGEGEVLSEDYADAVLHYVIALEAVLGDEDDKTELTRKIAQRAAVLIGVDDQNRRAVEKTVRDAYGARSAYAHGRDPNGIDLPDLRRVVRDCILAWLILGDPTQDGSRLGRLADAALLDHALLAQQVRGPIQAFWAAVA